MKKRRVVVTGLGVVAANGIGIDKFWDSVINGKSGVSRIESFDTSEYPVKIAAEIKNFNPLEYMDEKTTRQTAKFGQFALVAAKEAMKDSGLNPGDYNPEKTGVALGTSSGGLDFAFDQYKIFLNEGYQNMDTFITYILSPNAATRSLSLTFTIKGPTMTFSSSCTASADAIGYGLNMIRNGITI